MLILCGLSRHSELTRADDRWLDDVRSDSADVKHASSPFFFGIFLFFDP